MAWIVADSFDYYGNTTDVGRSVWDSAGASLTAAANTRFGVGQALFVQNGADQLIKNFGNESTVFLVFAFYRPGAISGTARQVYVNLRDVGTNQCTVCCEDTGAGFGIVTLRTGDQNGAVLATYTPAYNQDLWVHFQVRVVIDPTAGTFTVRKNGAVTDSYAATGLNTRGGTANSYVNRFSLGGTNGARVDDLLVYSGAGAAPNTWVGDCRAICLMPNADTAQKQFASFPTTPTSTFTGGAFGSQSNAAANLIQFVGPTTPTRGGVVTKISTGVPSGSGSGHFRCAIYLADGAAGGPGTFLGQTVEVTTVTAGTATDLAMTGTPVAVSPGVQYWLASFGDAAWPTNMLTSSAYDQARTYGLGFPATAAATSITASRPGLTATISGQCIVVSELLANGDTDYVLDATVGDFDLYDLSELPVTPFAIIGVVSKVYIRKSDAGTRQGQLLVKSGATQVAGVDTAVSSTYQYLHRVDAVDPNTGAAWTLAAISALQIGQKVTL